MRHKTFILLIVLYSLTSKVNATIIEQGNYWAKIDNENSVSLTLDDDNYLLEIISFDNFTNVSFSLIISKGKFFLKNDILKLKDTFSGYELNLETKKDKLICIGNSFKWLKEKELILFNKNVSISSSTSISSCEKLVTLLESNFKYNNNHNTLYYGNYSIGIDYRFNLNLKKQNKVLFSFRNLILLEGTFKRYKNLLIFRDHSLCFNFYFSINHNAVSSFAFPCLDKNLMIYGGNTPDRELSK
ncbi:MAG: hypothetical protein EOM44_15270 [Bacteroidia bacterium]|nr:hypothetical protein [Bacteroidia bacterium]